MDESQRNERNISSTPRRRILKRHSGKSKGCCLVRELVYSVELELELEGLPVVGRQWHMIWVCTTRYQLTTQIMMTVSTSMTTVSAWMFYCAYGKPFV